MTVQIDRLNGGALEASNHNKMANSSTIAVSQCFLLAYSLISTSDNMLALFKSYELYIQKQKLPLLQIIRYSSNK